MTTPKSFSEWDEDFVLSLPLENDSFERKPAGLLDLTFPNANKEKILDELACQLSAFANMSGGTIIYGLKDSGKVDNGGVSQIFKGSRTTKEWLEDVIPTLTDYEILGVNVHEIAGGGPGSKIASGKSLILVSVPASDRAPHQSTRGKRYYVRLGSQSLPASHRMIEDIRNRRRHPLFEVSVEPIGVTRLNVNVPADLSGVIQVGLRFWLRNIGSVKASNVCLGLDGKEVGVSFPPVGSVGTRTRRISKPNTLYLEIEESMYPGLEIDLGANCFVPVELKSYSPLLWVAPKSQSDILDDGFSYVVYADSAPPASGKIQFRSLISQDALRQLTDGSRNARFYEIHFDPHRSIG